MTEETEKIGQSYLCNSMHMFNAQWIMCLYSNIYHVYMSTDLLTLLSMFLVLE